MGLRFLQALSGGQGSRRANTSAGVYYEDDQGQRHGHGKNGSRTGYAGTVTKPPQSAPVGVDYSTTPASGIEKNGAAPDLGPDQMAAPSPGDVTIEEKPQTLGTVLVG